MTWRAEYSVSPPDGEFEAMAGTVTGGTVQEATDGARRHASTWAILPVLGTPPMLGRAYSAKKREKVAVIVTLGKWLFRVAPMCWTAAHRRWRALSVAA